MSLFELQKNSIMVISNPVSKAHIMEVAAGQLSHSYELNSNKVLAALKAREAQSSTAYGNNIAIPHARMEELERAIALIMRLEQPINFGAIDGEPVDLLFFLLSPLSPPVQHLRALAALSRLSRDRQIVAKIRGAKHQNAIFTLITERQERDAA